VGSVGQNRYRSVSRINGAVNGRSLWRIQKLELGGGGRVLAEFRNFRRRVHDERLPAQLIEQRLGVLQIGGVEALGEPAVDIGENCVCFVAAALRRE
jgi:hypothetical protein